MTSTLSVQKFKHLFPCANDFFKIFSCLKLININFYNSYYRLIDLGRKLDKMEVEVLKKIAHCLRQQEYVDNAIEILSKIGELESILQIHIEMKNWPAAFSLIEKHHQYESVLYMSYAEWLVENDKFVDAQKGRLYS